MPREDMLASREFEQRIPYQVRCGAHRPLNALLPLLTYFNASTAHRHIFLATDSTGDLPQDLQMQSTVLWRAWNVSVLVQDKTPGSFGNVAMAPRSRAPDAQLARKRQAAKRALKTVKDKSVKTTASFRKRGGYGKGMVSPWEVPAGGIKKSPAYRLVVARCGRDPPPAPKDRDGAPLKGGFPISKYPPNVLVDGIRAYWVPDEWAQVVKNTGPGGTYVGWMSPEGKFFYHRFGYPTAIQETLGRELTAVDGFNGILRAVGRTMSTALDQKCLKEVLSAAERKLVLPAAKFHFGVVSARRATLAEGILSIMHVEAHFRLVGIRPTWYVDAASEDAYKKLGLKVKVGGKLTPARNMALDDAQSKGLVCVQVSDDISKWEYYDCEKQNYRGQTTFTKANQAVKGVRTYTISPLAAAQFLLAKMRSSPDKPKLGGVFPTRNHALALGAEVEQYLGVKQVLRALKSGEKVELTGYLQLLLLHPERVLRIAVALDFHGVLDKDVQRSRDLLSRLERYQHTRSDLEIDVFCLSYPGTSREQSTRRFLADYLDSLRVVFTQKRKGPYGKAAYLASQDYTASCLIDDGEDIIDEVNRYRHLKGLLLWHSQPLIGEDLFAWLNSL
ncbi:hypothetical protein AK812_SmicGene4947 [Symbiodinium microadriaticum]|uniref:Uncharacterized protein n=1 Tax=Symbiodinium microadriaticum TaxID=2951 RepID=A0A1Q9EUZ9_SYMMI|nr:hypothetical protein AK812_SmicGene4947 [Symbiodinium microadriaticum]